MDAEQLQRLALRQLADYDALTPNRMFSQPSDLTTGQAYQLQEEVARLREQRGETIIGYKVGCTSRAIQEQLGIAQPIFGRLFDTGCHDSGAVLSFARYARLAIEGELAVRLGSDLPDPALPVEAYEEAIAEVFPVIELHHFVLCSPRPCCPELIASNGMHAGIVLAEKVDRYPGRAAAAASLRIQINEVEVEAVRDSVSMSSLIGLLRWLAERLAGFGLRLTRGQVILTGSPLRLHPVTPGSRIVVKAPPLGQSSAMIGP
jgi:2-keto-4-pentenoate hydratase